MLSKKRIRPVILKVAPVATNPDVELRKPHELMPLLQKGLKFYGLWPTDHPSIWKYYMAAVAYLVVFSIPMVLS